MQRCLIFAAGTFYGLRQAPAPGDLVIAADAGYRACREAGIVPDLLLGDFDSMDQPSDFPNVRRSPVEKDDTDTMLAVKTALEEGCGEIHIYGGTGGWTTPWPTSKRCSISAAGGPGAGSMTRTSSGPSSKTRV